jgi:diphthine methyl ester acylhydrolase
MATNSYSTCYHSCSIESVPNHSSTDQLFVCGMYELNEEESNRKGAIAICDENGILSQLEESSGILDMKFAENLLACALSTGDISLYEYHHNQRRLTLLSRTSSGRSEGLALSLCWYQQTKVSISSQNGSLLFYSLTSSGLQLDSVISSAHLFHGEPVPAWIIASSPHQPDLYLSGGDDCCLKLWDLKQNHSVPLWISSKHFQAGVTSAQWHPHLEHIFAVGSYDQTVSIWDQRNSRQPLCEMDTGGGVWRIKWAPDNHLAIASMQGGSGVYQWNPSEESPSPSPSSLQIIDQQLDSNPNRLVYGIDWISCPSTGGEGRGGGVRGEEAGAASARPWKIATCSFYDNLIQVWDSKSRLSRRAANE